MSKKDKVKNINLYTHKKGKQPIRSFRPLVFELLGTSLYEITDTQEFIFQIMKRIYPINKFVKNDKRSIDEACIKFFSFLPVRKAKAVLLTEGKRIEVKSDDANLTPTQIFLQTYLQLDKPPGFTYKQVQELVKEDLREINELIKYYESTPVIQLFLTKGIVTKGQENRKTFDFYSRCIKEQKVIIDYYLNGIKNRAIAKANHWPPNLRSVFSWSEAFKDRPYHFARYLAYSYFDSRKIDLIANKIFDFPFDEGERLTKLYETNKAGFYRKLFKRNKPVSLMHEIDFFLGHLPLDNNRTPIFEELKKLFKAKRWIAYYSLALTQIEGLFTEMYNVLNPGTGINRKSLPEKVESARPFHDMSHFYFDYYQYHIPLLRNKFMHTGFDEDFQLKSFDLLFDLRYLIKIFFELNNPLVKVTQLHAKMDPNSFITYSDFASYFELINALDSKQRNKIAKEIEDFEKNFLVEYSDAGYVCLEVAQELPKRLNDFIENMQQRLKGKVKEIDFANRNLIAFKKIILADPEVVELLSDYYSFHAREFDDLYAYRLFLNNFKIRLPSLNKDYIKILEELMKKTGIILNNVIVVKEILPGDVK